MTGTDDRFAPSLGFVLAGVGVATGFLRWIDPVAIGPVESVPGVVFGLIAFGGFTLRRYGLADRRSTVLAGIGSGGLLAAASVAVLHPSAGKGVGVGVPVAFVVGLLALGVATGDYLGQDRRAVLVRGRYAADALFIGLTGLLVGFLFSIGASLVVAGRGTVVSSGVGTVAFSLGLGVVAIGYLVLTDRDWSFIDVAMPTRRGWLYVIGGTIGMFGLLGGLGVLTGLLGIPSAEHGLVEEAREAPMILLVFVPLSWLAIGPGEELLSRNIVQKHLYDGFSRPSAVLVGTLVFTAIHLPAYATGPPSAIFGTLLQLFVISLVLGIVYERTENVVVPALVHGTYNAVQFVFAYLLVTSGGL
ncbi:MAG: lysostaphin resistance A-like protein [Halodesulfurarchaeum sp.]